mgnify:FL=1
MGKKKNKGIVDNTVVNIDFPRTQFRQVKQMDHMTMKRFVENVYMQGYDKAAERTKDVKEDIKPDKMLADISQIKGIGDKKLTEIAKIVNSYLGCAKVEEG